VPSTTALVVQIALGLGLLFVAWRQQARRGRPKRPPSWLAKVDHMSVPAAIALGFLVQPWPLVAAGAASVMQADLSETSSVIALILFCLLATGSYVSVAPATAGVRLRGLNDWIGSHTDQIIIGVSAFIGAWLIARGAYQLLS
jgi:hypothetical protein